MGRVDIKQKWYVKETQEEGPYSTKEMKQMIRSGVIYSNSLIRSNQMDWCAASKLDAFRDDFETLISYKTSQPGSLIISSNLILKLTMLILHLSFIVLFGYVLSYIGFLTTVGLNVMFGGPVGSNLITEAIGTYDSLTIWLTLVGAFTIIANLLSALKTRKAGSIIAYITSSALIILIICIV